MGINDKKRKKKGLGRSPEAIPYTDDNMKHVAWCMNNSIVVGLVLCGILKTNGKLIFK